MKLRDIISEGTDCLIASYPEREAREMVLAYLEYHIGTSRHTHIIEPSYEVSDDKIGEIRSAFTRMVSGEPLQYVTGKAYFYGREFKVTPDVLIPRPETELLCRYVIDYLQLNPRPSVRILDLCTGSGCIAWTLAMEIPGAEVWGVDISEGALSVAVNQGITEHERRAPEFIEADVLDISAPITYGGYPLSSVDILVSNPPYVMDSEKAVMRPNVLDYEPHLALFVPDNDPLLFYRAIAHRASQLLKPGGYCIVEINEALGEETASVFRSSGFSEVCILADLNDKHRFISFKL